MALAQPGRWTVGVMVNDLFSVAGSTHRPYVNQMLLQYFINYNMKQGRISPSHRSSPPTGGRAAVWWTVPFGGGVGRIMKLGFQPVNITAQFYGNAVYPSGESPLGACALQIALRFRN